MSPDTPTLQRILRPSRIIIVASLVALYFTAHINYLLFHTMAELFSIVVAFSLFMIAWNSRQYIRNAYLLFIGIAYLFIGFLDLLHTLSYKGMPVFTDYDFYANQLWIGARYMEALTLLIAFAFLTRKKRFPVNLVFTAYTLITALLVASTFTFKKFPVCFVEGPGLTHFKVVSEYIISAILLVDIALLTLNRHRFERRIYLLLFWSIVCTIVSELAFTFYISNYGFSNLVGHYFKIFSFFLVYDALIQTGIKKPYNLIFRDLEQANHRLAEEIEARKQTETERLELIDDLTKALEEIKTLRGIIPICSHCKKVRDDDGYWEKIEDYLYKYSGTELSHGICPDCLKKYYPDLLEDEEKDK